MAERPNFYHLLDLDLSEDDWGTIEKRIREKQLRWAKDSSMGSPRARREAKRNLGLLAEMRSILEDPASRQREAEAARGQERATREAEERKLAEWLHLLRSAGSCNDEQFEKVMLEFDGVFSAQEIEERLAAAGIRRVRGGSKERRRRGSRESLDSVTAATLRRNLELLGKDSLYAFLGQSSSSTPEELRRRADEIYEENHRLGRTDAPASAANELAGLCKTVFNDQDGKQRYDNFRVLEVLAQIKDQIELAASDRVISLEEMATLVQFAQQRGLDAEDARDAIEEYAEGQGWAVQRASPVEPPPSPAKDAAEATPAPPKAGLPRLLVGAGLVTVTIAAIFVFSNLLGSHASVPPAGSSPVLPAPGVGQGTATGSPAGSASSGGSAQAGTKVRTAAGAAGSTTSSRRTAASGGSATAIDGAAAAGGSPGDPAGRMAAVPLSRPPATRQVGSSGRSAGGSQRVMGTTVLAGASVPTPEPTKPALPASPVVAVFAEGERLMASAVEDRLQSALRDDGLEVSDGGLQRRVGDPVDLNSISAALAGAGVHVLVIVYLEPLGRRELSFYGRKDIAYTAHLKISVLRTYDRRSLGSGWSNQIEYTTVDAAARADEAVQAVSSSLIQSVRSRWAATR